MTPEQIMNLASLLVSLLAFVLAFLAARGNRRLGKKLKDEYWTKEVTGKTINAKTGKDQKAAEKLQEQILNGEATEVPVSDVKQFCETLEKNIENDPIPCCNPFSRKLGFSYFDNQKYYVVLSLAVFQDHQGDLPIPLSRDEEVTEFIGHLIDHYKEKAKK